MRSKISCKATILILVIAAIAAPAAAIPSKMTPLKLAAHNGDLEKVISLIASGTDPDGELDHGVTPLHLASRAGHLEVVRCLIDQDANVNICRVDAHYYSGITPLQSAAFNGHIEIVKLLLQHGAIVDIDPADHGCYATIDAGGTALMRAAKSGHIAIVKLLLKEGASTKLRDRLQRGILHITPGTKIAKILIDAGAPVHITDNRKNTPLTTACMASNVEMAKLLVAEGAKVNHLHEAVTLNDTDLIQKILKEGVEINEKLNGRTPLFFANKRATAKLLIDSGADVKLRSENNNTPLQIACQRGHLEIVKLLVECGADITARSRWAMTPGEEAAWKGHKEILEFLVLCGLDMKEFGPDILFRAASGRHPEIVRYLIDLKVDLNDQRRNNYTPLHIATFYGQDKIVRMLLDNGAKFHDDGASYLCAAISRQNMDMVKLLLKRGADVNSHLENGWTPLHAAVQIQDVNAVKLLLDEGADPYYPSEKNQTPKQLAEELESKEILELFGNCN